MSAIAFFAKIYRRRRIIIYNGACFFGSHRYGLICIVNNHFFTKRIDIMF